MHTEMEKNLLHSRHFKLSKETFENFQHVYDLYGVQVQGLPDNTDDIRKKLGTLWDYLKTSPNKRSIFRKYTDYNQYITHTISSIEQKRLKKEKLSSARRNASKTSVVKNNVSSVIGANSITKRTPMTLTNISSTLSLTATELQINKKTSKTIKTTTKCKSLLKKNRITGISRRRSERRSGNLKKRRSITINGSSGQKTQVLKIIVTAYTTHESIGTDTDGGTYDSFPKCIEPRAR
uniref:Uncharacterized protein n=1 Tax=Glossina pallidipes TaxID=7398 RepID=A0A1A9Z8T3_GLOPL